MTTERLQKQDEIHTHPIITPAEAELFYWMWRKNDDGILKSVHIEWEQRSLTVYLDDNTAIVFPVQPVVFGQTHPSFERMGR